MQNTLNWTIQMKKVANKMRYATGLIRRLSWHFPNSLLKQIVFGLVISSLRYGLSVYGPVRMNDTEAKNSQCSHLQKILNENMRILARKKLSDRVSIENLISLTNLPSVNRLSIADKLMEVWKSFNISGYPSSNIFTKIEKPPHLMLRSNTRGDMLIPFGSKNDLVKVCTRLWNDAPLEIRQATSHNIAKNRILKYVRKFPI